jgi:uncharacterized protein with FMN-binding domain
MKRYKLVLGGTAAGVAGVLAFPARGGHLTVPPASASTAAGHSTTPLPSSSSTTPSYTSSATSTAPTRTATSSDQTYPYGRLAVTVTVKGTTITDVRIAAISETDGRSAQIDSYAIPQLEEQVIKAGSVNIQGVSGATFTSQAFVDGVANALQKLGVSA